MNYKQKILFSVLSVISFILVSCEHEHKNKEAETPTSIYQVEDGIPMNVMLTAYSTTVFPSDTTLLRVALTDELAREIITARDSIRIFVNEEAMILDELYQPLALQTDKNGHAFADLYMDSGELKAYFVASKKEDVTIKLKAEALDIEKKSEKIWPGEHEIHVLNAGFKDLIPSHKQLSYHSNKTIDQCLGADVSFIPQTEEEGKTFKLNEKEVDALKLMKETGFNYIRLRIFVHPELEKGYAPDKGFCGLDKTLDFAKRVKAEGFKILLDFHYSDYWADPQKQFKPKAWENLSFDELTQALEDYTYSVMQQFKKEDVLPDMVQVGNEINHGMVWPDGHISQPDQLASLLKAGIRGVEKTDASIPVMLHVALGGQNTESVRWFNNMIARDVKFDIIGLSYYPRWHGTLADLEYNIKDLINRYHKPVNIVEYNWYKKGVNDLAFQLPETYQSGTFVWEPLHWQTDMADYQGNLNEEVLNIYKEAAQQYLNPKP